MESGIYEDLNDMSIGDKLIKAQEENKKLLQHIEILEVDICKLCKELTHMKERESNLKKNISELFNTAMVETNRKQRIINDLQTTIDNLNMKGRGNRFHNSSYKRERDDDIIIETKKLKPDFVQKDNHDDKYSYSSRETTRGGYRLSKHGNVDINEIKKRINYPQKDNYDSNYMRSREISKDKYRSRSTSRSSSRSKSDVLEQNQNNQHLKIDNNYCTKEDKNNEKYKRNFVKGTRNEDRIEIEKSKTIVRGPVPDHKQKPTPLKEARYCRRRMEFNNPLTNSKNHNATETKSGSVLRSRLEETICNQKEKVNGSIKIDKWNGKSMKGESKEKSEEISYHQETMDIDDTVKRSEKINEVDPKQDSKLKIKVNQLQENKQIEDFVKNDKKSNKSEIKSISFEEKLDEINHHHEKKETNDSFKAGRTNNAVQIKPTLSKRKLEKRQMNPTLSKEKPVEISDRQDKNEVDILTKTSENNSEIKINPTIKESSSIEYHKDKTKEIIAIKTAPEMKQNSKGNLEVNLQQEKKEIDRVQCGVRNNKTKQERRKPEDTKKVNGNSSTTEIKKSNYTLPTKKELITTNLENCKSKMENSTDANANPSKVKIDEVKKPHPHVPETEAKENECCKVLTESKIVKNVVILSEDRLRNFNVEKNNLCSEGVTNSIEDEKIQNKQKLEDNGPKDVIVNLNSNNVESVVKNSNDGVSLTDLVKSSNSDNVQMNIEHVELTVKDKRINSTYNRRRRCVIKLVN